MNPVVAFAAGFVIGIIATIATIIYALGSEPKMERENWK